METRHALSMKSALCIAAAFASACGGAETDVPAGEVSPVAIEAASATLPADDAALSQGTTVEIVPASVRLERAREVQFAAIARDRYGAPVAVPVVSWSATGGTVTPDGRYTAGPWGGDFAVFAQAGSSEAAAAVLIED